MEIISNISTNFHLLYHIGHKYLSILKILKCFKNNKSCYYLVVSLYIDNLIYGNTAKSPIVPAELVQHQIVWFGQFGAGRGQMREKLKQSSAYSPFCSVAIYHTIVKQLLKANS